MAIKLISIVFLSLNFKRFIFMVFLSIFQIQINCTNVSQHLLKQNYEGSSKLILILFIFILISYTNTKIMYTPIKPRVKILNSSFSPFTSLASSKISTNCDLQRNQSNSLSKKRFARKRQSSNDSLRRLKTSQTQQKISKRQQTSGPQNIQESPVKKEYFLTNLNFKKDSILTSKYVKMPTDRSETNEQFSKRHDFTHNGSSTSRSNYRNKTQISQYDPQMMDYKMQLEMKNSEFMILQDENNRMKKEVKSKEVLIQRLQKEKQLIKNEMQEVKKLQLKKIQKLEIQLQQKNKQIALKQQLIEKNEKAISKTNQNLKKSQKQIQLLKIHLQQVIIKKVSKENLQLISYKQLSLQNQLNQLKTQFDMLKTQQHKHLQIQLNKIRQQLSLISKDCQNLSIANRILSKKNVEIDVSIEKKYKNQLTEIKDKLKSLMKQSSSLKKENASLRKTIHFNKKKTQSNLTKQLNTPRRSNRLLTLGNKKTEQFCKDLESDESFTISLSK